MSKLKALQQNSIPEKHLHVFPVIYNKEQLSKIWNLWTSDKYYQKNTNDIIYKTPINEKHLQEIARFTHVDKVEIYSDIDSKDRVSDVCYIAEKEFEKLASVKKCNRYFYLFEFPTQNELMMEELSSLIPYLTNIFQAHQEIEEEFFWAAKYNENISNRLRVTIVGGR